MIYQVFSQTEANKEDDPIIIKITRAIVLLLVEYDPGRWKKHIKRENGKWMIYALCNKVIYGTLNTALIAYKKLAKILSSWGLKMNP